MRLMPAIMLGRETLLLELTRRNANNEYIYEVEKEMEKEKKFQAHFYKDTS